MKRRTSSNDRPAKAVDVTSSMMLKRLGLDAGASGEQVAAAHDAVITFLSNAPREMRTWARTQAAAADEANAFLSDPAASRDLDALVGSERDVRWKGGGPDDSAARRPAPDEADPGSTEPPSTELATDADKASPERATRPDGDDGIDAVIASVTPSAHRDAVGEPGSSSDLAPEGSPTAPDERPRESGVALLASNRTVRRAVAIVAAIMVLAVVAVGGYSIGTPPSGSVPSVPADGAAQLPEPTLDTVQVAALMSRIQDDPTDADALIGLGDEYFTIGGFETAAEWFRRALTEEPENVNGHLALGAASFNQGDLDGAEMQWLEAIRLEPENLEGHYDLGWVYLNRTPPDMDGLKRVWGEVIRLAPDSDVAQTVRAHLDALASTDVGPDASSPRVSAPTLATAEPVPETPAATRGVSAAP